ncbi:Uncharacterized protein APZ42_033457 [Daphnia magna]|uniref:BEN domain-containing protein n=1 Tax=Daphnia magna TaxID=35525 RepID=A0A164L2X5_9CRUS|nr:Uncharacterized protein APZ42_033457 [Daphnia magna]
MSFIDKSFKMSSKKSSYLDSIHILFKVKSTGDYTVGTAGMISLPKLPLENLVLLDKIQSLMDSKAEIKIRLENLNGKRQVLVATIHEFSSNDLIHSESYYDDEDSLYHKPSSGVSESNTLASLSSSTILTALENTAEENCGSVLVNNHSTPSRHQQVDEKDEEIESLKADILQLQSKNPDNLVKSKLTIKSSFYLNEIHSTSREHVMVQLVQGHNLRIEKSDLKFAITIGRLSSGNLHLMVNKIMESIYTRVFMSNHTLTGMAPRAKKVGNTPPTPVKPDFPREDVLAITRKFFLVQLFQDKLKRFYSFSVFMIQAWKVYHNQVIKPKDERVAIRSKLSTESRAILAINTTDLEPGVNTIDEVNEDSANCSHHNP